MGSLKLMGQDRRWAELTTEKRQLVIELLQMEADGDQREGWLANDDGEAGAQDIEEVAEAIRAAITVLMEASPLKDHTY